MGLSLIGSFGEKRLAKFIGKEMFFIGQSGENSLVEIVGYGLVVSCVGLLKIVWQVKVQLGPSGGDFDVRRRQFLPFAKQNGHVAVPAAIALAKRIC